MLRLIKDDEHADPFDLRAARDDGTIDVPIIDPIAHDLLQATAELATESWC